MKAYQRVLLFLLVVLFLTALLSPWIVALWNFILEANPGWQEYRYSFSKIFNRLFMILAIVLFFPFRRLLKIPPPSQIGLKPLRLGYQDLLRGFFLTLLSIVALSLVMSWLGVFTHYFRLTLSSALERSLSALLAALTVGFLEEIFFRGVIFKGLLENWGLRAAFVFTNVFYSSIHFVRPSEKLSLSGLDPWAGVLHLIFSFEPLLNPITILPGLVGLFLIGMVLAYAFFRTSSLYLSMGLHAGWVFGIKTIRVYGDFRREDLGWLFGSSEPKIVSGILSWIGILAVGIVVHLITRHRQRLSSP